ncbi:MAG: hypothetical protein ACRYG5_09835 [Janthinobacterium lividum]
MAKTWTPWTEEQDKLLEIVWHGKDQLRLHMDALGHSYAGITKRGNALYGKLQLTGVAHARPCWDSLRVSLAGSALSIKALSQKSGVSMTNTIKLLREHRGKDVYVAGWECRAGAPGSIWALGKEKDAPRPAPMTSAQRYKKLKADPERWIARKQRREVQQIMARPARRDDLSTAFFGAAA